jgi:hypothetical protein
MTRAGSPSIVNAVGVSGDVVVPRWILGCLLLEESIVGGDRGRLTDLSRQSRTRPPSPRVSTATVS